MVRQNNDITPDADLRAYCSRLCSEARELRRIAGLNIIRAAHIADVEGDEGVARLLLGEAAVMMSVATQIEELFGVEDNGHQ